MLGTEPPRACKGQLLFNGISSFPVWLRWMLCPLCGAFTAVDVKGGLRLVTNSIPKETRFGNDPDYRISRDSEQERPYDIRNLSSVQSKRVGGPIGRY